MKTNHIKIRESKANHVELPVVMTIAGSDSSGGAGIEADLKTFSAFGVYGMTCITALTAQNTKGVKTFEKTSSNLLSQILLANFEDFYDNEGPLKVIKTGMLTKEAILELTKYELNGIKFVIDPVMISTSGSTLIDTEGIQHCINYLIPKSYLVTPNFVEAKTIYSLLGGEVPVINTIQDFKSFVISLQNLLKCENLLVKGGHIPFDNNDRESSTGERIIDILYQPSGEVTVFESKFIKSENTHGTGCSLSSAIAANLAKNKDLVESVGISIDYIHKGMLQMSKLGHGNGPLNHNVQPVNYLHELVEYENGDLMKFDTEHTFLNYLINHPSVKDNWKKYTQHPFVQQVANNTLPFDKFLYYLKQDYHYLIIYARMHGLSASKAETYQQTHSQATIISEIVQEIENHKRKLKAYDVDYDKDIDELKPGKACIEYCDYLISCGMKEDYLGIKTALAPCLHGYAEAGVYGLNLFKANPKSEDSESKKVYKSWLDEYTSDWYQQANIEGTKALNSLVDELPKKRVEELVRIFNDVTLLEINFWSEVLELDN
ncbi:THI20 [Candida pseudojiufengensis]|uniref:THI20 n=1 Tax=Candida pseudojiufengensis TaxID=497109 RepID=UPI0022246F20|nr:THI20 [Candida pseudojiufengensis]KAI5958964.1 THI20 [Candida pseudojiufengensis]